MFNKDDLLHALQSHIGKDNGASVSQLVIGITHGIGPDPIAERRVRKLVQELRMEGHHICAMPETGYFIAANDQELNDTCEHLLERAMSSLSQVSRMKNVSLPDLRGQLNLPT